jgi:hypothetical protein
VALREVETLCRIRYVDAMLCSMQTGTQESQPMRSHSLRMWVGMVMTMPKVIEFYTPNRFRKPCGKWTPPEGRGKVIPFFERQESSHHEMGFWAQPDIPPDQLLLTAIWEWQGTEEFEHNFL